jgi:hypothetical protein
MIMINADAVLESIRASILAWEKAERGSPGEFAAAERMTARFAALDDHLKNRGNPPKEWLGPYPAQAETPPPAKEQMEEFREVLRGPGNLMGGQDGERPEDAFREARLPAGSSDLPCEAACMPGAHVTGCPNKGGAIVGTARDDLPARRRKLLGRW